jgi:dihydrofolate reductase
MIGLPFKAIAAMSLNRVIGAGGKIPWHLPEDFRWFKECTLGHTLVMGRKTYESIGRPLPGRRTLVLSRSKIAFPGATTVGNLEEAAAAVEGGEVFICGGAEIYALALPHCSDVFLTRVLRTVDGDTFLPPFEHGFERIQVLRETAEFRIEHFRRRAGI